MTDLYNTQRQFIAQHGGRTVMVAPTGLMAPGLTPMGGLLSSGLTSGTNAPRLAMYLKSLAELRFVMISKMAKPEEVLIVEDENGEIVRAPMKVRPDAEPARTSLPTARCSPLMNEF